jgi:KDO2-lipid IV(A) lauroyltransferase
VTIRICLPELNEDEQRALLRRSLRESARMVAELGPVWTWSRGRLLALVREVDGEAHLQSALAHGRGVILVTPHLGAWELAGLYCSSRFPLTMLYRQADTSVLARFMERGRGRFGASLAPSTSGGLRMLMQALDRGEAVAVMPDQEPRGGSGLFAPFFGVQAHTTTLVWRLARRSGAPAILGFAERLEGGRGFRIHLRPLPPAIHDADAQVSVSALNLEIERLVREYPEQYLWSYKRFRIRPSGEPNPYRVATYAKTATR